jgi:hypothetical protein
VHHYHSVRGPVSLLDYTSRCAHCLARTCCRYGRVLIVSRPRTSSALYRRMRIPFIESRHCYLRKKICYSRFLDATSRRSDGVPSGGGNAGTRQVCAVSPVNQCRCALLILGCGRSRPRWVAALQGKGMKRHYCPYKHTPLHG